MEKIYRLLDWLTLEQAVDWLQDLTNTQLTESQLSQLCEARQCNAYMDVDCLHGWEGNHEVCGNGIHRLLTTSAIKYAQAYKVLDLTFEGPVCLSDGDMDDSSWGTWQARVEFPHRKPCFKPADIQTLAAKINGEPRPLNAAELNELELERAARESAEAEVLELRKWIGDRTLSNMRAMLKDDLPLRAMTERAETAEKMVAAMDRELKELRELRQRDAGLFEKMTERLGAYQKGEPPITKTETPVPAPGLTFSRPSNALIVAHAASCKFWRNFDPERPPLQKQVTAFMIERGVPARQAAELAIAIKPDDLPKS